MQLNDILSKLNDVMYTYVLIIMLVGVGIYFPNTGCSASVVEGWSEDPDREVRQGRK